MCRREGWFSSSLLQERVYKSEHLGLEQGVIFRETDQLIEDFIQTRETATLGQGGFGEFTLVQGSKIQLNQLWYRLRVQGSQRHIPTQKFLKVLPRGEKLCFRYHERWKCQLLNHSLREANYRFEISQDLSFKTREFNLL